MDKSYNRRVLRCMDCFDVFSWWLTGSESLTGWSVTSSQKIDPSQSSKFSNLLKGHERTNWPYYQSYSASLTERKRMATVQNTKTSIGQVAQGLQPQFNYSSDPLLGHQEMVHTWPCGCWWEESVLLGLCKAGFHLWNMWHPKEYGKPEASWNHGSKSSKSSKSSTPCQTWVQRVFFRSLPWVPLGIDRVEVPDSLVPGVWCGPMRLALTAWVTPRPSSSRIICFLSTVEVCFCALPTWNSL